MPFKFELKYHRSRVPDQTILSALRALAHRRGQSPTMREWDQSPRRPLSSLQVAKRFRTWRNALAQAGLQPRKVWRYSPEEMIDRLESAWKSLGAIPGKRRLIKLAGIGPRPYIRHWGTLRHVYEQIIAHHERRISREALLRGTHAASRRRPARKPIPNSLRYQILARDHHRCQSCGASPLNPSPGHPSSSSPTLSPLASRLSPVLEVDHLIPLSRGGSNHESNLRTLCRECNNGKSNTCATGRRL